jgi:hypothetical protein
MNAVPDVASLKAAFTGLERALATGDLEGFYGAMLGDAVILDEDLPFLVDKKGFQDHIAFHGPANWDGFAWKPRDIRVAVANGAGSVVGFAMFRGKPKDAGFRLRPMMFSQGWAWMEGRWRMASWHQSPIIGHVSQQSPA